MTVRIFSPPNRLAKVLSRFGGRTAKEISAVADARVEEMRGALIQAVDAQVGRILALHRQGDAAMLAGSLELGDAALNVAELAGAAGRPDVGDVARGLRAMTDFHVTSGRWRSEALEVHIAALALLNTPAGLPREEAGVMLQRLHDMRAAVGVPD